MELNNGTKPKQYKVNAIIEAVQFTEQTATDIVQWSEGKIEHLVSKDGSVLIIKSQDIEYADNLGVISDYVVKGHNDNFFFVSEKEFPNYYDEILK